MIEGENIKISDYGLQSLKKFINLTAGYTNKSVYTAPEILTEKGRHPVYSAGVVTKPSKKADIYALGLIMF